MQVYPDVSFRLHTPPRKPGGVDSLCGVATLLFKVPCGPYTGAPATRLTNLLNEVVPHGMHAACDLSTPEAFFRSLTHAELNIHTISFDGSVFPVHPDGATALGMRAYPSIAKVPCKVDLALVASAAETVPTVIGECADAGVKGAIILSQGFDESGLRVKFWKQEILEQAGRSKMRIIGPNCLGVMSPLTGPNATFAPAMAHPGDVAFISQSGALCSAILDWSLQEMVGFSAFVSLGSMLDVGWGELIEYLGDDPHTRSIVLYMESIGDARSFLSAAREVALIKPILVIKPGHTEVAARLAASRRGSEPGNDEVFEAALRRSGVLRIHHISDLFHISEVLAKQPHPKGPRLTMITNASGPAFIATDELLWHKGELAELSKETIAQLNAFLPSHWSHCNPIHISSDAGPQDYQKAIEITAREPHSDGLLVILTPQGMTDPAQTAEQLSRQAKLQDKPILASWMGGTGVAEARSVLHNAGIPAFPYPDTAARAFAYMWRYSYNLRSLYETPGDAGPSDGGPDHEAVVGIIQSARERGSTELTEGESKRILSAYGIPTVETDVARCQDAYELFLRSSIDPQFGPVLQFGSGGQLADIYKDTVFGLPPLNTTLARRLLEQTKIFAALEGTGSHKPVDLAVLDQVLVRFSRLVVEQPWIKEIVITPLLASADQVSALDARIVLHGSKVREEELPAPAIRPYPLQYVWPYTMKDGTRVTIRPIRPEDEPLMVRFHASLSDLSVLLRYSHSVKLDDRVAHERLRRICFISYDRELALVAERRDPETGTPEIVGVGRLTRVHGTGKVAPEATFAVVVSDAFQNRGLGSQLLRKIIEVAKAEKLRGLSAEILQENRWMQLVSARVGFRLTQPKEHGTVRAELSL